MTDEQTIRAALSDPLIAYPGDALAALDRLVAERDAAIHAQDSSDAMHAILLARAEAAEKERDEMERRLTSALAASEEAIHQMHDAKDRLRDYQDDIRTVMSEECPDPMERHCMCVPPLRKAAQAAEARCATLEAALDALYEAHGCRDGYGDRSAVGKEGFTCGECEAALDALAAATPPAEKEGT